jgi:hypothetical protein
MVIGFTDLIVTAVLHSQGLILELNPIMRFFIERSEWLFAIVKAATLVAGWFALVRYFKANPDFVHSCSKWGSVAYVLIWLGWFASSH